MTKAHIKPQNRQDLGKYGEKIAHEYLKALGFTIIDHNWRCSAGEADIIAWDDKENNLVFCEVKTRRNLYFGHPLEAVTEQKLRHMYAVAHHWKRHYCAVHIHHRIDVISIYWDQGYPAPQAAHVEYIQEIFKCH